MAIQQPSNVITCDICHRDFPITKDFLEEKRAVLEKEGLDPTEVALTVLTCPLCGKTYPVIVDDPETVKIRLELESLLRRRLKYVQEHRPVPFRLAAKIGKLNGKLDFKRQSLAKKYNGSFYQTDEGKQQLDYRYHVR